MQTCNYIWNRLEIHVFQVYVIFQITGALTVLIDMVAIIIMCFENCYCTSVNEYNSKVHLRLCAPLLYVCTAGWFLLTPMSLLSRVIYCARLPREAVFVVLPRKVDNMLPRTAEGTLPRTNLAHAEPYRSGSLSCGKGISVCCARSVETGVPVFPSQLNGEWKVCSSHTAL
jgi:hypothetical protein